MKQLIIILLVISAFLPKKYNIWYYIGRLSNKIWKNISNLFYKETIELPHIVSQQVMLGCDPEFFLEKDKKIIGSEKLIKREGLGENNRIIIDGVQAELNPNPSTCRQVLASNIQSCFHQLDQEIKKKDKGITPNFSTLIEVNEDELKSLRKESRILGCAPSKNIDPNFKDTIKLIDPEVYRKRSAGGHIHLGKTNIIKIDRALNKPKRLITIMDIIVGNTCVLLDRDPGNIERRKTYGKAGEYRTPPHGVEYRTLSNFWLRSYPLMSFVTSISRLSVNILSNSTKKQNYEKELLKLVNMEDIRKAINENDFKLALKNFKKIRPFLNKISNKTNAAFTEKNLEAFDYFIKKGIDHWFKLDPVKHWLASREQDPMRAQGWETFIISTVKKDMEKEYPIRTMFRKKFKKIKRSGNKKIIIRIMLLP